MRVATSEEVVTSEDEARRSVMEEVKALEDELKDASPLMIMDKVSALSITATETTRNDSSVGNPKSYGGSPVGTHTITWLRCAITTYKG